MTIFAKTRPGLLTAGLVLLGFVVPLSVWSYRAVPVTVGAAVLLLAAGAGAKARAQAGGFDGLLVSLLAALVVWALVSLAWTTSLPSAARVLVFEVILSVVSAVVAWWGAARLDPGRMAVVFGVAFVAAAALLAVEVHWDMVLHRLGGFPIKEAKMNQASVLMAVWIWPVLVLVGRRFRWPAGAVLWAITFAGILMGESETAKLALVVGAIVLLVFRLPWTALRWVLAAGLAVVVLLQPWFIDLFMSWLTPSLSQKVQTAHAYERLVIWEAFTAAYRTHPWAGFGFNASGWLGQGSFADSFAEPLRSAIRDSHPHNMLLQVWVELGAVGGLLLAALLARAAWLATAPASPLRAAAAASFAAGTIVALVGYGAWQAWWIASLAGFVALLRLGTLALGQQR